MTNDLGRLVDIIDANSKFIGDISSVAKNVLAKNPDALDNTLVEDIIKNALGESVYDKIRKIYQEFVGT
jgi:hypothetical protein